MKQKLNLIQADEQVMFYLKTLLERKGLGDLSPEILANMLMDLFTRFNDLLLTNFFKAVSAEKQAALDELLAGEPKEHQVNEFVRENIADYDKVIADTMREFEAVFLGDKIKV